MKTHIKICGITRPEDAAQAAVLGADYLGLNFFSGTRQINFHQARQIMAASPDAISWVGLIGDQKLPDSDPSDMRSVWNRLALFQHYDSNPRLVALFEKLESKSWTSKAWLVLRVASPEQLTHGLSEIRTLPFIPAGLLLDAAAPGQHGGTGKTFNWNWIARARESGEMQNLPPIILAGGLTPDNVAQAIRIVRPYAVDVSSGVEVPNRPGIKDPIKIRDFIQAVHAADTTL